MKTLGAFIIRSVYPFLFCLSIFLPVNFGTFFQLYKLEKTAVWLVGVRLKTQGFRVVSVRKFRLCKITENSSFACRGSAENAGVSIFPVFRSRKVRISAPKKRLVLLTDYFTELTFATLELSPNDKIYACACCAFALRFG